MVHETALIKSFVKAKNQDRFLSLVGTVKGRQKLRTYISHFNYLDEKYAKTITLTKAELEELLHLKKVPESCYVISENSKYDMQNMPLDKAISTLYGSGIAYFISCIAGKIVIYEDEYFIKKLLTR